MYKKIMVAVALLFIIGITSGCESPSGANASSPAAEPIETEDSLRFKEELEALNSELNADGTNKYTSLSLDSINPINYLNYEELVDFIDHETGFLYFGRPGCPWCRLLIPIMLDYAKGKGICIYYYDIEKDRTDNSEEYKNILSLLGEYLPVDTVTQKEDDPDFDPELKRVVLPQLFFMENGKVKDSLYLYEHEFLQNKEIDKMKQLLDDAYRSIAPASPSVNKASEEDCGC
jgi:thiol-disulfide isomerase/thioredoxin